MKSVTPQYTIAANSNFLWLNHNASWLSWDVKTNQDRDPIRKINGYHSKEIMKVTAHTFGGEDQGIIAFKYHSFLEI